MGNANADIELFKILLNESPDAIFLTNTNDLAIEYCNDSAVEMFEFQSQEDFIGNFGHKYHKKPLSIEERSAIRETLSKNKVWQTEYEYLTCTGKTFWGAITIKKIKAGEKYYHSVRIENITEHKLDKERAEQSNYYLEQSLEALPAFVYMIDKSYNILYASREFKNFYKKVIYKDLNKNSNIFEVISETNKSKRLSYFEKGLRGEELKIFEENLVDGSIRSYEIHFIPIKNGTEVDKLLVFIFDVTDFTSQKYRLEESERKYRLLADHSSDIIFLLDAKMNFLYFSPSVEKVLGYKPDDVITLKMRDILTPESYKDVIAIHKESKSEIIKTKLQFVKKGGKVIWGENHASVIKDRNGDITAYLVITRDITQEKIKEQSLNELNQKLLNLNASLSQSNEELDRFVYRVSHDLKSPLNSVQGLLSLIENETNKQSRQEFIDLTKKSINKLLDFIKEISELSRNAQQEIHPESINLHTFFSELIESQQFSEDAKDINFKIDVDQPNSFLSDKTRLSIILNNLISNAIRYKRTYNVSSEIRLIAKVDEKQVQIEVYDNGQGILKEHLSKIFNMFYRANQHKAGSGLGLYIVKEILDKLEGEISVESEAGVYTKFLISLKNMANSNLNKKHHKK
ncbi:PAS domain-containing sensor histidine kinase [Chondrinema litorale]|uniref:PAS domain-containing sensor histidine kinase n=1 Tax=Chondrinema litorale TaxID=2994555 RepID=UPI002542E554|nr:PAS domain-containing sensor histidine kinase [Chondrinema litorale]UZR98622.1 PAS domain S-box protein [Chondrinema litorale]